MADILAVMDISGIATAIGAFLVAGAGANLLFVGYKFVKKAFGRA